MSHVSDTVSCCTAICTICTVSVHCLSVADVRPTRLCLVPLQRLRSKSVTIISFTEQCCVITDEIHVLVRL